jgi:hypothetical protein
MSISVNHSGIVQPWVENRPLGQNFLACDREQSFLLPPDVREWLPEDHLAWFVIDAVGVMDLAAFYGESQRLNARTSKRSADPRLPIMHGPRPTLPTRGKPQSNGRVPHLKRGGAPRPSKQ